VIASICLPIENESVEFLYEIIREEASEIITRMRINADAVDRIVSLLKSSAFIKVVTREDSNFRVTASLISTTTTWNDIY